MEDRNIENAPQDQTDSQTEVLDVAQNGSDSHADQKNILEKDHFPEEQMEEEDHDSSMDSQIIGKTKTGVLVRLVKKTSLSPKSRETSTHRDPSPPKPLIEPHTSFITLEQSQLIKDFSVAPSQSQQHTRHPKFSASHSGLTQFKSNSSRSGHRSTGGYAHSHPSGTRESVDAAVIPLSHQSTNSLRMKAYMFLTSSPVFLIFFCLASLGVCFLLANFLIKDQNFHENAHQKGTGGSEGLETPSNFNTVRFFDLTGTGHKFLFLVDIALSEETQFNSASTLIMKTRIKNSLSLLSPEDSFEILFFNTEIKPVFSSADQFTFHPATSEELTQAFKEVNHVQWDGDSDVEKAISSALEMKPDVIFFACQTDHLNQLNAFTRNELASSMGKIGKVQFCAVEIAENRKPLTQTHLQLFAKETRSQYQWFNVNDYQISSQDRDESTEAIESLFSDEKQVGRLDLKKYLERGTSESMRQMLQSDFDERFIVDISTDESRKLSPFGRDISTDAAATDVAASKTDSEESATPPKSIPLSNKLIRQIEADARIVYLSAFVSSPQNPRALRVGAESRLTLWVRGAKAELPAADYLVGLCYKNGVRGQTNATKAFQCELRAAENGCLPAMFLVSDDYFTYGTDAVSFESAKFWLEKGANSNEPFAQLMWANSFASNPQERFLWTEKAAQLGLPGAQFQLGQYYEKGTGTDPDHVQAAHWFEKAAQQGFVP